MYAAGSDTTVSIIASSILALLKYPEVLRKAQDEIDSVIPYGELPSFDDQEQLPFVTATCTEALRWRDATPIGIPHVLIQDDVYRGYRLPKGTIVIANSWTMLHDEKIYPDPFSFKPERFLKDGKINSNARDPAHAAFGFGRRECPGRLMAFESIWITMASLIAAFNITNSVDENGNVIEADPEYENEVIIIKPKPFTCTMVPRSKKHEQAIRATSSQQYDW
ncbi:hypothetical protein AX15_007665 [Amanita polypyramis BW_CC]|nr:hypothetical protein AX15_007665 [Amanita polypyramis BW_CC]